jgi:hypothetical protein
VFSLKKLRTDCRLNIQKNKTKTAIVRIAAAGHARRAKSERLNKILSVQYQMMIAAPVQRAMLGAQVKPPKRLKAITRLLSPQSPFLRKIYQMGTGSGRGVRVLLPASPKNWMAEKVNTPRLSQVTMAGRRLDSKCDLPHLLTCFQALLGCSRLPKWVSAVKHRF